MQGRPNEKHRTRIKSSSIAELEALLRCGGRRLDTQGRWITCIRHYQALISASTFAVLATCGPDGLDASPRGDPGGAFIQIAGDKTLLLTDRRG